MAENYLQRGVSASKEDVHNAVKDLDHGLYPKAFCKIYPDFLVQDDAFCNIMSADGSGSKSILAYLYWKETGDISVWQGIAQDAIVMNLDDLLCVGATSNFLLTSIINRNKFKIPGSVISEIILGTKHFLEKMADFGVQINLMGGETADLGDLVNTVTVDASMTARLAKNKLILTQNVQPGDVIIGLASYGKATYEDTYNSGISSNGLTSARHDVLDKIYAEKYPETYDRNIPYNLVYAGKKLLTDNLHGTPLNVGQALLSPTRTYAPIVQKILQELNAEIHGIINCTGGAHTKLMHYLEGVHVVKNNLLPLSPIFNLIKSESDTSWQEMFKVFNCGTRLEIYTAEKNAQTVIDIAKSFDVKAQIIGYVEKSTTSKVTIKTDHGEFQYF